MLLIIYILHVSELVLVYATLRVLNPECVIEPSWCQEPSRKMIARALDLLHQETVPPKGQAKTSDIKPLSAPSFCYVFPLIKAILQSHGDVVEGGQDALVKALKIVLAHTRIRSSFEDKLDEVRGCCGKVFKL